MLTSVLLGINLIWTWSFVGRYWPITSICCAGGYELGQPASYLRGSLPRRAASAWYSSRPAASGATSVGRPAAGPAPGTLNLFCFLGLLAVDDTLPPHWFRARYVKGGESGGGASTADQMMMCEGDLQGWQTLMHRQ